MTAVAIVAFGILAFFSVVQVLFAIGFASALRRHAPTPPDDDKLPKVAVLLCLRGGDPFLRNCLEGLFRQQYPNFDIFITVDSRDDPAWKLAEDIIADHDISNIHMQPLVERHDTCSLVNSSVVQAIGNLDESYEAIAILDADVIAHPTWLRELVAPLVEKDVAVTSGNRWYMPSNPTWAALVRYVWNAGAVIQMYWNDYTWGGSLAIKLKMIHESELVEKWTKAFAFDTTIYEEAHRQGYRVKFVPSLMMTNRETVYMRSFYPWVQRQMLLSRLYHPGWPMVLGQALVTSAALVFAGVVAVIAAIGSQWTEVAWALGGLLLFLASVIVILATLESAVRKVLRVRDEAVAWLNPAVVLKLLVSLPLTQAVYSAAIVKTMFMRNVDWRGISYVIDGPFDVRLLEYRPFQTEPESQDSMVSL